MNEMNIKIASKFSQLHEFFKIDEAGNNYRKFKYLTEFSLYYAFLIKDFYNLFI